MGDEVVKGIAEKHGKSVAQVVLRWILQIGVVTIPKSDRESRIRENADIFDFELDGDTLRWMRGSRRIVVSSWGSGYGLCPRD